MENKFKKWYEQEKYFGLDYPSAQNRVGDYEFEIRYDCDLLDASKKPDNCGLYLSIRYKGKELETRFGNSIEELKAVAEKWWEKEISNYKKKHLSFDDSKRKKMRKEAISVFELTKGFTTEPTDNAMKTALEMAGYVMQLTNDLE